MIDNEAAAPVQELIEAARAEGTLRPDVGFGDIGLLIARLSQPLPAPFPRATADELAHRHLALLLDGLRGDHATVALPGPALTLGDLQALAPEPAPVAPPVRQDPLPGEGRGAFPGRPDPDGVSR